MNPPFLAKILLHTICGACLLSLDTRGEQCLPLAACVLSKTVAFRQSGADTVLPLASNTYHFEAVVQDYVRVLIPGLTQLQSVTLHPPGRDAIALLETPEGSGVFKSPTTVANTFATSNALEAAFPTGEYSFDLVFDALGSMNLTLVLEGNAYPNVPVVQRYPETQRVTPGLDFVVPFSPMTNASAADIVSLGVQQELIPGTSPLVVTNVPPSSSSITIPGGVLASDAFYLAQLAFVRTVSTVQAPVGEGLCILGMGTYSTMTSFWLNAPVLTARAVGHQPRLEFNSVPGRQYVIEASADLRLWHEVLATNATANSVVLTPSPGNGTAQFFRVVVPSFPVGAMPR